MCVRAVDINPELWKESLPLSEKAIYKREKERDIQAGVQMAQFLLGLPAEEFAEFKAQDLHIIPKASWNRLSMAEQSEARAMGLVFKGDDYETHGGMPVDEVRLAAPEPSGSMEPSPEPEEAVEAQEEAAVPVASLSQDERTWFVLRHMLDLLISQPNPRLSIQCLRIASGLGDLDNITESSVAREHGLTRAAVSKRCKKLCRLLGIKPSQYMRPLNVCDKYRTARFRSLETQKSA